MTSFTVKCGFGECLYADFGSAVFLFIPDKCYSNAALLNFFSVRVVLSNVILMLLNSILKKVALPSVVLLNVRAT
jgi:hypothetical protein